MLDIGDVWSGHPVGFALVTTATRQYVADYDTNRDLTVAQRAFTSDTWTSVRLPTTVGWDATTTSPWTSTAPASSTCRATCTRCHWSTSAAPRQTTPPPSPARRWSAATNPAAPPLFFHDTAGNLVFNYRDGSSGSGNHIFNIYDAGTKTWRRLLNAPFTDGQGQRNAYPVARCSGPMPSGTWSGWARDGRRRDQPRSVLRAQPRFVQWETAAGANLTLPITLATSDIVDPVPVNGGMINNNTKVGFKCQNRPTSVP